MLPLSCDGNPAPFFQVAESLGITEELLRRRGIHADGLAPERSRGEVDTGEPEAPGRRKREDEVGEAWGRQACLARAARRAGPLGPTGSSPGGCVWPCLALLVSGGGSSLRRLQRRGCLQRKGPDQELGPGTPLSVLPPVEACRRGPPAPQLLAKVRRPGPWARGPLACFLGGRPWFLEFHPDLPWSIVMLHASWVPY